METVNEVIYTYGGGETLFHILNGVAMILKSDFVSLLKKFMTVLGAIWAMMQVFSSKNWMPSLNWVMKYALVVALLIEPTMKVAIRDVITKEGKVVDGVPFGLGIPATIFSSIGYGITATFEQYFQNVDANSYPEYTKYGTGFGAALMSQIRNFKIQDANFRDNMRNFMSECVLYDVQIGTKYSPADLKNSQDIWHLVKSNASNLKMFNYREKGNKLSKSGEETTGGKRFLVTCADGAKKLDSYWSSDITDLERKFLGTVFSRYGQEKLKNRALSKNLDTITSFYNLSGNASNVLQQIMFVNAMSDLPLSYGAIRSKQAQTESWFISGELAKELLPAAHAVIAGLLYASFTIVSAFLVLPSGLKIFGTYLSVLLSIELWPAIFSVLNLMVSLGGRVAANGLDGITLNNISYIVSSQGMIAAFASYLMLSVPWISWTIIRGGGGAVMHSVSQGLAGIQSFASSSAAEIISGNRSFDNQSIANTSMMNNSAFKTDLNPHFASGVISQQLTNGVIMRNNPNGNTIFQGGAGLTTSSGTNSYNIHQADSAEIGQTMFYEKAKLDTQMASLDEASMVNFRNAANFNDMKSKHSNFSNNWSHSDSASLTHGSDKMIEDSKEVGDSFTNTYVQGVGVVGNFGGSIGKQSGNYHNNIQDSAPIGVGEKAKDIVKSFSPSIDLGGKFDANMGKNNEQALRQQNTSSIRTNHNTSMADLYSDAKEVVLSNSNEELKSTAKEFVASYEHQENLKQAIDVQKQKVERLTQMYSQSQSVSFNASQERTQEVIETIANYTDGHGRKLGMIKAYEILEGQYHDSNFSHSMLERAKNEISGKEKLQLFSVGEQDRRIDNAYTEGVSRVMSNTNNMKSHYKKYEHEVEGRFGDMNIDNSLKNNVENQIQQVNQSNLGRKEKVLATGAGRQVEANKQEAGRNSVAKSLTKRRNENEEFDNK